MVWMIGTGLLAALVGGTPGFGTGGGERAATLTCANPRLPAAILAGSNAAVSGDVVATALPTLAIGAPKTSLTLAVADDDANRDLGLMCVTSLRRAAGMVFVFPAARRWEFWMKNTVVPLDMVWVAPDGRVTTVAANVPAATLQTPVAKLARRSGDGRFVIELAGGEAARDGIVAGTRLELPAALASLK